MKQVLLLAMIHLLIFHQNSKDKKERLSPQQIKKETANTNSVPAKEKYLMMGARNYSDSLFSWHPAPAVHRYYVYPPQPIQQ